MKLQELLDKEIDAIGDDHIGSNSEETPIKKNSKKVMSVLKTLFLIT